MVFVFILSVSDLNVWFSLMEQMIKRYLAFMSTMYAFLKGFRDILAFHPLTKQSSVLKLTTHKSSYRKIHTIIINFI